MFIALFIIVESIVLFYYANKCQKLEQEIKIQNYDIFSLVKRYKDK